MVSFQQKALLLVLSITGICRTGPCRVTVTQPQSMEVYKPSNPILIPCTFSAEGCPSSKPSFLWFRYLAYSHENVCTPQCVNKAKFIALDLEPKNNSLQILDADVKDSAIYFCGVAFQDSNSKMSKQTGSGTVLVIRESWIYSQAIKNLLLAALLLLLLYLLALAAISKFFSEPKFKETGRGDLEAKNVFSKDGKRAVSQAIAKEVCKRKHRRTHLHLKKGKK